MYSKIKTASFTFLLIIIINLVSISLANSQSELKPPIIRYGSIHRDTIGFNGMVVSQNDMATKVGHKILLQGGNAIDAAVATGFALAVTLPRAGNLGGGGFMLIHLAEENNSLALNFRSKSPSNTKDAQNRKDNGDIDWQKLSFGANASAVPGTVAGLFEAWKKYGSMPWEQLLQPAIELAEKGIKVSVDLSYVLDQSKAVLATYPSSAKIFLTGQKRPFKPGDRLVQKDLAWSLKQIHSQGAKAFYQGELSDRIIRAFAVHDSHFTKEDFSEYKVQTLAVVSTKYRNHNVITMPPPSAGGITLLQMLNTLSNFDLKKHSAGSSMHLHLLAEVMKRSAANRRTHIGDPDFFDVPVEAYLSKELASELADSINHKKASKVKRIRPSEMRQFESRDTTHFSVMDTKGNAVSVTYTLGYSFGSGFVAEGTGILFNNQMRNFYVGNSENGPNAYAPGKRMISTMTPTIVLNSDNEVFLVTGSPGGSRIINVVLQLLVNVIDYDMRISDATHQPRLQQGWRNQKLGLERGFSPDTLKILQKMGHEMRFERSMGSTQSILYKNGIFRGAADPRRPNALAMGLIEEPSLLVE